MIGLDIGQLVIVFGVLLFSLTVHESAHAWSAARLGDHTARRLGRISFNPVRHVDPIGTVLLPLVLFTSGSPFVFGWAKPVPVNTANLKRPRQDFLYVAAAGPASNIILAVLASLVMSSVPATPIDIGGVEFPLWRIASVVFNLNLLLAVFNMVPVPPLDGGNVLAGLLPEALARGFDQFIRPWGFVILLALLLTGTLSAMIVPPYLFLSELLTW